MSYIQTTYPGTNCPKCQRKLTLLVDPETHQETLAICFKCKQISDLANHALPKEKKLTLSEEKQSKLQKFVALLPDPSTYKGAGSQLRLTADQTYQRSWLSLREYEKQFGESLGFAPVDLRQDKTCCKWCGKPLPAGRRSFCKDSCSRNYSKATFTKRTTPAVPYRIACRDDFTCQGTGADLAIYNRFGQRIPASNGTLVIHHLIPVSENGTDHERNLLTLSQQTHVAYHSREKEIVTIIDAIKAERFKTHGEVMAYH